MRSATFFVSTGRCGTQWLARSLAEHYGDIAVVEHEPSKFDYEPRFYFGASHRDEEIDLTQRRIAPHLREIIQTLTSRHYVECGWPAYGVLPYLRQYFGERLKVVHLSRHPARVAASLLTHRFYTLDPGNDALLLFPSDDGVSQTDLQDRWNQISEHEKCLFWWTEINHYALAFHQKHPDVPWLSVRFEDLFSDQGDHELGRLLQFLEFPSRESFLQSREKRVDRFHTWTEQPIDGDALARYPKAADVMRTLGYEDDATTNAEIIRRYQLPWFRRVMKRVKGYGRRLIGARPPVTR